jgi:hypothetical protein
MLTIIPRIVIEIGNQPSRAYQTSDQFRIDPPSILAVYQPIFCYGSHCCLRAN